MGENKTRVKHALLGYNNDENMDSEYQQYID